MPATLITVGDLVSEITDLEDLLDDPELAVIVRVTGLMLDAAVWGDALYDGHLTLAAHFAILTLKPEATGAGGAVTSERLDKLQVSYATGQAESLRWSATKWGLQHSALLESLRVQRATHTELDRPDFSLPDGRIL